MTTISPTIPRHPLWFRHPRVLERVTGVLLLLAVVGGVTSEALTAFSLLAIVPPVAALGAVIVGLRRPRIGLVLIACAPLLATATGVAPLLTWTIAVFAVFLLTLRGAPARLAGPLVALASYVSVATFSADFIVPEAMIALSLVLAAAASGSAIRGQVRYLTAMNQRAADAIATRDVEVNRGVAEERLRIARDLHDVVGHEVAVLGMQLGVIEVSLPDGADNSRAALVSARSSVKSILFETQRILDVLRVTDGDGLSPTPGIQGLAALVASYEAIGLTVAPELRNLPETVDPAVSAAVFRITQEALTNAHRYGSGSASVMLATGKEDIILIISNLISTTTAVTSGSGYGIVGMRERASSVGGSLVATPVGNAFRVTATLPLVGGAR